MPRNRILVNTSPFANHYANRPDERIIEISSPHGGGLVSLTMRDDGTLTIEPYRLDGTVNVEHDPTPDSAPACCTSHDRHLSTGETL